jgi:peroxiredoxin (alkyl hydroperoxide reductase subunit C)
VVDIPPAWIAQSDSEKRGSILSTLVTQPAPDFSATAVMPDNAFKTISLSDYRGKYVVLFFYPLDFTFVCPSEILGFNSKLEEFRKRDCELIGVSVDSHFTHLAWKNTDVNQGGIRDIQYPLGADIKKEIAADYGILQNGSVALRGLFLIDREGAVRHAVVNDLPLGRSVDEALRMLDALRHTEEYGEVCPVTWREGQEAMRPTQEGVASYLSRHSG